MRFDKSHHAESPLFARYYDLLLWLNQCTAKFPRIHRFELAKRIMDTAYASHAAAIRARKVGGAVRAEALLDADVFLESLRSQWRMAYELNCVSAGQYEHGAGLVNEVGKLLGSWRKD